MSSSHETVLSYTEYFARSWFSDDPEVAEHLRVRTLFIEEALSPVDPSIGVSERSDGTMEVDSLERPMFQNDHRCADYNDDKGKVLIDKALHEQDADADAALCEIIFQHIWRGRKLPPNLRAFLMVRMRERFEHAPERPREIKRAGFRDRNMFIVRAVARLHSLGIAPTRSRERRHNTDPCGCSIVAEALTRIGKPTTERAAEEVWLDRDMFRANGAKHAE